MIEKLKEIPLPKKPQDISLEWLNLVLNPHQIQVVQFTWAGDANHGRGYLSSLNRVNLQVRKNSSPILEEMSIILKTIPTEPQIRAYTLAKGFCRNELQMYTKVLPAVNAFLDERGVSEGNRYSHPFCYFGAEEEGEKPEDYNFILVLEDLIASSFQVWEEGSKKSFNSNHTEVAVKQIALFHAATAAYKLHHGFSSFLDQFPKFIQHDVGDPAWDHYIKNGFKAVRDVLNGPLPQGLMEHLQVLEEHLKEVMFKMAIQVDKSALNVVRHSDLHFFNVAFSYDEAGDCVQAKWFDFQLCSEGRPMMDLAFFLLLNCEPEFSSVNLDKFLTLYHETFMGVMEESQVSLEYSLDTMKQEFSEFRLPSILNIICGAPVWCCGPDSNEVSRDRFRRAITYAYEKGELTYRSQCGDSDDERGL